MDTEQEEKFNKFWDETPAPTKWGEKEQCKNFINSLFSAYQEELVKRIEKRRQEYDIAGEKADTFIMKGEDSEHYSVDMAEEDVVRYCSKSEALDEVLNIITPHEHKEKND